MIVLDENTPEMQQRLLKEKRIHARQIGEDIGRLGMQDEEIISLLHQLDRPTFFTLDEDYYVRRWCHRGYCLVHLHIEERYFAKNVRRVLKHPELNTKAKRMGLIIRVQPDRLSMLSIHERKEAYLDW